MLGSTRRYSFSASGTDQLPQLPHSQSTCSFFLDPSFSSFPTGERVGTTAQIHCLKPSPGSLYRQRPAKLAGEMLHPGESFSLLDPVFLGQVSASPSPCLRAHLHHHPPQKTNAFGLGGGDHPSLPNQTTLTVHFCGMRIPCEDWHSRWFYRWQDRVPPGTF